MDNVYLNMDVGCLYPVKRKTPVLLLVVYEAFELVLIFGKVDAHRLRGEGGRKVVSQPRLTSVEEKVQPHV